MITVLFLTFLMAMSKLGYGFTWVDWVALLFVSLINVASFAIKVSTDVHMQADQGEDKMLSFGLRSSKKK